MRRRDPAAIALVTDNGLPVKYRVPLPLSPFSPSTDPDASRGRLDSQERTVVFVCEQVQEPVGSLAHFTNTLPELP